MTHPLEVLLSDEFAEFSGKVTALHEKKKELKREFKKYFEDHKAEVKGIDEEAKGLQDGFNAWAGGDKEKALGTKGAKLPKVG